MAHQFREPSLQNLRTDELLEYLKELSDEEDIKATIKGSLVGGLGVGAAATTASLVFGPVGLLIGGAVGGLGGYLIAKDKYKSLSTILSEMNPRQREKLRSHFELIMRNIDVKDLITLAALTASDTTIKAKIVTVLIGFTVKELGVQIMN